MNRFILAVFAAALVTVAASSGQAQTQLLTNGGFETGNLSGWTTLSQISPDATAAGFFVGDNTLVPGDPSGYPLDSPLTPVTFQPTAGPKSGTYYAVTDGDGAANNALLQSFTVPIGTTRVTFSFSLFVNARNGAGAQNTGGPLAFSQATPTQFARVDLLTATAQPFSLSTGNVVRNFYTGVDASVGPNPLYPLAYSTYSFDITANVVPGETYQVRFADVGNQFILNTGVDDVSVTAFATVAAPEPAGWGLLALGLGGLGVAGWVAGRGSFVPGETDNRAGSHNFVIGVPNKSRKRKPC